MIRNPKPSTRRRVYAVAIGLVAVAVFHGVVTEDEGQLWLAVLAPALGLAVRNVPPDGR